LQAALTLTGDRELMEPFLPTAELVELLALRAKHLAARDTPGVAETGGKRRGRLAMLKKRSGESGLCARGEYAERASSRSYWPTRVGGQSS
jgi:hypothetical protein